MFETIELTSRYLDELLDDVTDEQIRADEADFNARLRALTDTLPQLADIWVDRVPTAIRSCPGTVFPMPRQLDLSDRDYFRVHRDNRGRRALCRRRRARRAPPTQRGQPRFFTLSRKRTGTERRVRRRDDDLDLARLFPRLLRDA